MKVGFKITAHAEPLRVAASSDVPLPQHDGRALAVAVRHLIKRHVQALIDQDQKLRELGIRVEVQ